MPTYEFRCPEGHEFEKFYRSIGGAPRDVACPMCGKKAERQMSAGGGLVFKGSGFYITDYGKDGKKSQTPPVKASDQASASNTGAESGGAKGESKAAADAKPASEPKASPESKSHEPKPAAASKSAAKKAHGKAKSSE
jgi:putative FmdB family regulatory protein